MKFPSRHLPAPTPAGRRAVPRFACHLALTALASFPGGAAAAERRNTGLGADLYFQTAGTQAVFSSYLSDVGHVGLHVIDEAGGVRLIRAGLVGQPVLKRSLVAFKISERAAQEDLNGDGDRDDDVVHLHRLATGRTENLGIAAQGGLSASLEDIDPDGIPLRVSEAAQGGQDLNGDGDIDDAVLAVYLPASGQVVPIGLAVGTAAVFRGWVALTVPEWSQGGADLNGDGDSADTVLFAVELSTGVVKNLGLACSYVVGWRGAGLAPVREAAQGADLTGDGDREDRELFLFDPVTGQVRDSGVGATGLNPTASGLLLHVPETARNADLNGDGDLNDAILHILDLPSGRMASLGLEVTLLYRDLFTIIPGSGLDWLVAISERANARDLTGDGDLDDEVFHALDLETKTLTSLGTLCPLGQRLTYVAAVADGWAAYLAQDPQTPGKLRVHVYDFLHRAGHTTALEWTPELQLASGNVVARSLSGIVAESLATGRLSAAPFGSGYGAWLAAGDWVVYAVREEDAGEDLNGDGDLADRVLGAMHLGSGAIINLQLATEPGSELRHLGEGRFVVEVSEYAQGGVDLNGDGDSFDGVYFWVNLDTGSSYIRGDCNIDGAVNLADVVFHLDWSFKGGKASPCPAACDVNADGLFEARLDDPIQMLRFLFQGGLPPLPPFPACGASDPDDGGPPCLVSSRACAGG